jgi:hypothetical protein
MRKENTMTEGQWVRALGATIVFAGVSLTLALINSPGGRAHDRDDRDDNDEEEARIEQGFDVAPVQLDLDGKNRKLVGLGSYLVNLANCNDCHDTGPRNQFVMNRNPFFGQPKQVNPKTYLGGGRDFGELAVPPIGSAHIISRNLTPDKSGLPEGGNTFSQFLQILRTGVDMDGRHPTCTGAPNSGCVPPPFHGDLLQVMPWPNTQGLTHHDIRAIYEYLSAVPCVQGNDPFDAPDRCP